MAFTFPNELVALSVLPFLMMLAAAGFSQGADRLESASKSRRRLAGAAFFVLLLLGQGPGFLRFLSARMSGVPPIETRAIREALATGAAREAIASSNAAISFQLFDPFLFGIPGRYRPLPVEGSCADLVLAMERRGAKVAILDRVGAPPRIDLVSSQCPVALLKQMADPARGSSIWILERKFSTLDEARP
jgi:hypothetical protein